MRHLRHILRDCRGGNAIEYALVAALIAVAAVVAFQNLGTQIDNTFIAVDNKVGSAT
ncbi:MAG TPA: Flp family type IVb pilin [Allosphingosinicella sp.]|jgi:pilus assembly protein Flp/PilA